MADFIFGYGSLICAESRQKTGVTGPTIPARVEGIERCWQVPVTENRHTVVGASLKTNSACNGVLFETTSDSLRHFDRREKEYHRVQLPLDSVEAEDSIPSATRIWTYVGETEHQPTPEFPITQSYLDVIIQGCLAIHENFLQDFLETTHQWGHWINDRHQPRYPRALNRQDHHDYFDCLLSKWLPNRLPERD